MLETLVVYIGLALLMCHFFRLSEKYETLNKKGYSVICFLIPILLFSVIFGMRYYVGIDYPTYLEIYEKQNYRVERFEPVFYWITTTCGNYNLHFSIYFGIIAFIQAFFFFSAFRNDKKILRFLPIVLIFSGVVQVSWMNGMRQACAMCIFVFALSILSQRNLKSIIIYYALIALAIGFHKTALILAVVPLILLRKDYFFKNVYVQIGLVSIFFVGRIFNLKAGFLDNLDFILAITEFDNYSDVLENSTGSAIGIFDILTLLMYIFLIIKSPAIKQFYKGDNFFRIVYDLFIVGICLDYFFSGSMMLRRAVEYFSVFSYPIFAYYWAYYFYNKKKEVRQMRLVISVYIVLSFVRLMSSMTTNTAQFAFYFQDDLRPVKEMQHASRNRNVN